jgi:hypothetical protein
MRHSKKIISKIGCELMFIGYCEHDLGFHGDPAIGMAGASISGGSIIETAVK